MERASDNIAESSAGAPVCPRVSGGAAPTPRPAHPPPRSGLGGVARACPSRAEVEGGAASFPVLA